VPTNKPAPERRSLPHLAHEIPWTKIDKIWQNSATDFCLILRICKNHIKNPPCWCFKSLFHIISIGSVWLNHHLSWLNH
jgi:hypothetical protein